MWHFYDDTEMAKVIPGATEWGESAVVTNDSYVNNKRTTKQVFQD